MASQLHSSTILPILEQVLDAFNRHDLDAIMTYFAEDATLDMPRGPDSWGRRVVGKAQVREALAGRLAGIPDVRYGEARHFVCGNEFGVTEWTLTGATTSGVALNVCGCDHYTFRDGQIVRKDSYWKIVE
jgi:ketosteroid isomerase-like protein